MFLRERTGSGPCPGMFCETINIKKLLGFICLADRGGFREMMPRFSKEDSQSV